MLATRAARAIKASGVVPLAGSADLPTQALDFEVNHGYFSDDGLNIPRELLERIPSQISGLEIKLEEAEAAEKEAGERFFGEVFQESSRETLGSGTRARTPAARGAGKEARPDSAAALGASHRQDAGKQTAVVGKPVDRRRRRDGDRRRNSLRVDRRFRLDPSPSALIKWPLAAVALLELLVATARALRVPRKG